MGDPPEKENRASAPSKVGQELRPMYAFTTPGRPCAVGSNIDQELTETDVLRWRIPTSVFFRG